MAKLRTLKPLVTTMKPRLVVDRERREQTRLRERDQNVEWRKWYKTSRWQKLRKEVLLRDNYICQRTGVLLIGKHPAPNSAVVDHIKPHNGDEVLFWDMDNLQSVTKDYHDSIKQAMERADKVAAIHPKWLQPSIIPLTIVCGPAGSGKSTYVTKNKGPYDLVIDLDVIASEISAYGSGSGARYAYRAGNHAGKKADLRVRFFNDDDEGSYWSPFLSVDPVAIDNSRLIGIEGLLMPI